MGSKESLQNKRELEKVPPTLVPSARSETHLPKLELESSGSKIDKEITSLTGSKARRLEYFQSGINADCEVHVANSGNQQTGKICYKKFKCHRIFLATVSEKLEQDIFENRHWNGVLQINGVSSESVEICLEYIYTFEISVSKVNLSVVGDLAVLSSSYNIPELLKEFCTKLKDVDWPVEELLPAFNLAFRHNMVDLENTCLGKMLENSSVLKSQPSIMELQIYAFNFLLQHWLVIEALPTDELISLLKQYQQKNNLNFKNTSQFPHFIKILKYFPNILLDAEGFINVN